MKTDFVILRMTEEQARIAQTALEFYARLQKGQFAEIRELVPPGPGSSDRRQSIALLEPLLRHLVPELPVATGNVAFGLYQCLRHLFAWEAEPAGGVFVQFDGPTWAREASAYREPGDSSPREVPLLEVLRNHVRWWPEADPRRVQAGELLKAIANKDIGAVGAVAEAALESLFPKTEG